MSECDRNNAILIQTASLTSLPERPGADKDEGTPWPDTSKSGPTAANGGVDAEGSDAGDLTSCDSKGAGGEFRAKARAALAAYLPKAMMHLTRAASRARWGRSWTKVRGVLVTPHGHGFTLPKPSVKVSKFCHSRCA